MIEGLAYMEEIERRMIAAEQKCAQVEKQLTRQTNLNTDLWLNLMKLPGGLELARKINAPYWT